LFSSIPLKQAFVSPSLNTVDVPARHRYSHCASVGRSNPSRPVIFRSLSIKEPGSTAWLGGQFVPTEEPRISR